MNKLRNKNTRFFTIACFSITSSILIKNGYVKGQSQKNKISPEISAKQATKDAYLAPRFINPTARSARLGKPLFGPIVGDTIVTFDAKSNQRGSLVYAFRNYTHGKIINYIAVRQTETSVSDPTTNNQTTYYPIESAGVNFVLDPQFSRDGSRILFKVGGLDIFPNYALYVLDLKKRSLTLACKKDLQFLRVAWSPDGRYVAYVVGCDATGSQIYKAGTPELLVYDCQRGIEYSIAKNEGFTGGFEWTPSNTLLYTKLRQRHVAGKKSDETSGDAMFYSVGIYGATIDEVKSRVSSKLFFPNAFHPVVSKSGTKVAFFTPEKTENRFLYDGWWKRSHGDTTTTCDADGKNRRMLNKEEGIFPSLSWQGDEAGLLSLKQTQGSPKLRARLVRWNVTKGSFQHIATFSAQDYEAVPRDDVEPTFGLLNRFADGKTTFVSSISIAGLDGKKVQYQLRQEIFSVDAESGSTKLLAVFSNSNGFDWFTTS